jgi:hypothetical protein
MRLFTFLLTAAAAAMLVASLKFPLWHMRLEAPQYRDEEALKVAVFPNKYGGDLREIRVLNQYIGVHVPEALPQFKWLPLVLLSGAAAGLVGSTLPRRARRLVIALACVGLCAGVLTAAVQAKSQIHDIGHKRDRHTILAGIRDFTPPFLGTSKIAQFTVTSGFGLGAWLIGGAVALQAAAAYAGGSRKQPKSRTQPIQVVDSSLPPSKFAYQI